MSSGRMRVTAVRIYPVKSLAGSAVDSARVQPWGLAGDRRWGLVDEAGNKVTAREINHLLGLRAELMGGDGIRITDHDGEAITVQPPVGVATVPVGYSRQERATPAGEAVDSWLVERIRRSVRLVWQEDPALRSIATANGGLPGDRLSLADAAPLLMVNEASRHQLDAWIAADAGEAEPLDIVRFRPNVVVDGDEPFAEDRWTRVRIGDVRFRKTMICDRCVMTTIDPTTLTRGKEPIRTLARHRHWEGKTWFGIRLTPLAVGTISVGDPVVAEEQAEAG